MSCFIVSNAHLSAIVGWALRHNLSVGWGNGAYAYMPGLEQEAVNILDAANVKSCNARYKEDTPEGDSVYEVDAPILSPIDVIKACDCLAYQCSEWEGFDGSTAQRLLDDIRDGAITRLPGYESARWSI